MSKYYRPIETFHKVNKLGNFEIDEHVIPSPDLVNKPVKSVTFGNDTIR